MVRLVGIATLVFIILVLVAGFAVSKLGHNKVEAELIAAFDSRNLAKISSRVDWDGLQAFMKDDLAPVRDNADALVDYYVLPENLVLLPYFRDKMFPDSKGADFISGGGYVFPFGFAVSVAYPLNAPDKTRAVTLHEQFEVDLVFGLNGGTWQVQEMHVPPMMVPRGTPEFPAHQFYVR